MGFGPDTLSPAPLPPTAAPFSIHPGMPPPAFWPNWVLVPAHVGAQDGSPNYWTITWWHVIKYYRSITRDSNTWSQLILVPPHSDFVYLSARTSKGPVPWDQLRTIQAESMAARKPLAIPVPIGQNGCKLPEKRKKKKRDWGAGTQRRNCHFYIHSFKFEFTGISTVLSCKPLSSRTYII